MPCTEEVYREALGSIVEEWDYAYSVLMSATQVKQQHIERLQEIRDELEASDLAIPDCAENAHQLLLDYMNHVIAAWVELSEDINSDEGWQHLEMGDNSRLEWELRIAALEMPIRASPDMPCTKEAYLEAVDSIVEEWDAALRVAQDAPSTGLKPHIERLQEIRREIEISDIVIPECAVGTHLFLLDHMKYMIEHLVEFSRDVNCDECMEYYEIAGERELEWELRVHMMDNEP